jgi:DnaJ-like protein
MITLEPGQGGLRLVTPYDAAFLNAFKAAVPYQARSWQKPYWIVDPAYGAQVAALVQTYFGVSLAKPAPSTPTSAIEIRAIEVQYVGRCKDRGDGATSAYGFVESAWSVIFPEQVLRAWFGATEEKPGAPRTLYVALGITSQANDDEIKRAYRRMARQWHPDVCKEPDATEQFHAIKRAYDLLSDPITRKKYDAALKFEAALTDMSDRYSTPWDRPEPYRAPLRCGLLLCEGTYKIGRFVVSKILDWQDVVRDGKTMVSSWDNDNDKIRIEWV